jgi:hypothetical protein
MFCHPKKSNPGTPITTFEGMQIARPRSFLLKAKRKERGSPLRYEGLTDKEKE